MTPQAFIYYLKAIKAPQEILERYRNQPESDPEVFYNECVRSDWLLEIAVAADVDRRTIVRAACRVARTALRYVPEGEERPRKAIEAAERWCRGAATLEELWIAGDAGAAARNAAGAAAGDAARAAAWAAWAASDAGAAGAAARNAAGAAGAAARNAAGDARAAAQSESLKQSAAIVREFIPWDVLEEGLLTVETG